MCNHEPESPVQYAVKWAELEQRLGVDCDAPPSPWRLTEEGSIELLAERATRKGEQVLVPYGEETSSELLCTSGFVPSPNSAEYLTLFDGVVDLVNRCEGSFGLSKRQAEVRLETLLSMDAHEAPLAVRPGDLAASGHVIGCMRLLAATDDEFAGFTEDYVDALGHHALVPPASMPPERAIAIEGAAAAECGRAAQEKLAELPTTAAEDEEQLARVVSAEGEPLKRLSDLLTDPEAEAATGPGAWRLASALSYRLEAKRLLAAFARRCQECAERAEAA